MKLDTDGLNCIMRELDEVVSGRLSVADGADTATRPLPPPGLNRPRVTRRQLDGAGCARR
jgi:hypothetical protein